MSWFTINPPTTATATTNISPGNLTPAQVQLQLQQMQLAQAQAQAMQNAPYQGVYNQSTGIYGLGNIPHHQHMGAGGGMGGSYLGSGPTGVTVVSSACGPQIYPTQQGAYYIALPSYPTEGDHITLKFRHGGWREERSCAAEINPKNNRNNSGDFSLDEIDEARELIDELS